jgi:hypothetical protein
MYKAAQRLSPDMLADKDPVLWGRDKGTPRFAEADNISSPGNVLFKWNPEVHCYTHNIPPPVTVLNRLSLFRILSFYSLSIHFNIIIAAVSFLCVVSV